MAWNEPPESGNKDPWGDRDRNRGGKRNEGPPDLEEMLKRAGQRLRGLFGGGNKPRGNGSGRASGSGGGAGGILVIVVIAAVLWVAFDSFHIIDARQQGVVLRFGEYSRTLPPGPQFTWPRPIESVTLVPVTLVNSVSAKARMLTSDENLVDIDFAVQYRIADARGYLFNVKDPDTTLHQSAESVVRSVVGARALDEILVGDRAAMAGESRDQIQKLLDNYQAGLTVISVNFQNVAPPQEVKEAFDDAIKAREDSPRAVNDAEAYASQKVPEAKGLAAQIMQQAEGYKSAAVARATGDARRFALLTEQYKLAPEVTRRRLYLETMQEVLRKVPKVLVDGDSNKGGPMLYLPLDKMVPRSGAAAGAAMGPEGGR
jgi:modulator of FtsH protease HflK